MEIRRTQVEASLADGPSPMELEAVGPSLVEASVGGAEADVLPGRHRNARGGTASGAKGTSIDAPGPLH